ncbi:MAG TPA: UDP-N-acetylglucosamine acyltransferase [Trebonia sp.]
MPLWLGSGNRIDPTAVIGEGVRIGANNTIGPYAVIVGDTSIGDGNWIAPHAVIGTPAEWRDKPLPAGWDGDAGEGRVVVGDRNVIREFVTVSAGVEQATRIGDDCYLMARSHLGHDVVIEDGVTLATAAQLGGFSNVWSWAFLGLGCQVHQWGQIGPGAMVGMGAAVVHPVPPFRTVVGMPAKPIGINRVGLRRLGVSDEVIDEYAAAMAADADPPTELPDRVREMLSRWAKVMDRR